MHIEIDTSTKQKQEQTLLCGIELFECGQKFVKKSYQNYNFCTPIPAALHHPNQHY